MTVFDEAPAQPGRSLSGILRAAAAALSARRSAWTAGFIRVGTVFLPVTLVLEASRPSQDVLAASVVIAGIWFLALTTTARAVSVSPSAVGVPAVVAIGTLLGVGGVSAASFWVPGLYARPRELAVTALMIFVLSTICERFAADVLRSRRRVLLVGSSRRATELVDELAHRKDLPFDCVGVLDDDPGRQDRNGTGGKLDPASRTSALTDAVRRDRPDIVVLADEPQGDDVDGIIDAGSMGLRVVGLPTFYEHAFGRVPIQTVSPMWFMSVLHLYQRPYSRITKRVFDIIFAAVALGLAAPLMVLVAGFVYLFDRGPVFYRQVRLGEGAKTFEMVKFRTMVVDAERQGRPIWAENDDPRITRVGRLLRKVRLDELPQLWNVLRGDMSIVGPRPERPEFLRQLAEDIPFWTRRHLVKPGITGWAQVRHTYTSDVAGTAEKLGYDLFYLKHRSLFLDCAIVLMTAKTILSGSGAR